MLGSCCMGHCARPEEDEDTAGCDDGSEADWDLGTEEWSIGQPPEEDEAEGGGAAAAIARWSTGQPLAEGADAVED